MATAVGGVMTQCVQEGAALTGTNASQEGSNIWVNLIFVPFIICNEGLNEESVLDSCLGVIYIS